MEPYIHELQEWPTFRWSEGALSGALLEVRQQQSRLSGQLESLGFHTRDAVSLRTHTEDVVESSEIEGELLNTDAVRSSVARRLGMDIGGIEPADRYVDGVVEVALDAAQHHDQPLTRDRLFSWHAALFPTGRSGMHRIIVGAWREDRTSRMQVVSGPVGRERVHFEAPEAARLDTEMQLFLEWFNGQEPIDALVRAALAHLWFVTIHPFDDGNGRIARAIADMCLSRAEGRSQRFYSMSAQIRQERADYYRMLEQTQSASMNITPWMTWFLGCLLRSIERSRLQLAGVIAKAHFWERVRHVPLNERQRLMINRLLDGFEGKLTTSKWATLTKTSQDSALRDIQQLVERGVLVKDAAGGRSTSYSLAAFLLAPLL